VAKFHHSASTSYARATDRLITQPHTASELVNVSNGCCMHVCLYAMLTKEWKRDWCFTHLI